MDIPWNDAIVGPWIGGRLVEGQGTLVEDFSPSTGQLLGRLRLASAGQVDEAVSLAKHAQREWAGKPIRDRAEIVERLAQRVFDNADLLGEVDSQDTGSPVFPMQETARKGARYMKALAGSALEMQGRTIPASASGWHLTKLEPWGVVGGITAYNHPTHYSCLKSAPALIAGNAVVIKPSEQAPLSTLLFAQLTADLLPAGLLGILPGDATAGAALVAHRDVPRISFTGSLRTAAAIQQTVAETGLIKSLAFELGGKNPIVVCPDVDIDEVAHAIVRGMNYMRVQGQSCGSTSRLLIHSDIKDRVVAKVVELVEGIRVGLPSAPDTQMGSLISLEHRDRVIAMIDDAVADGAVVLTGGRKCTENELAAGAFMTPAVLDNVAPGTRMWREEVFGPVLGIHTWQSESEAVDLANDTEYGLTASVWSRNIDQALRIADAIDAGYVWVNDVETRYTGVPFGGWKQSGIGTEQGIVGDLMQCVRLKSVSVAVRERAGQA